MNRQDLVKILAKKSSLSIKKANEVVVNLLTIICTGLFCGEEIRLSGFGTFWTKFLHERKNFTQNGEEFTQIPARFVPKFRCSKILKKQFLLPKC